MGNSSKTEADRTVGLDLGDRQSHYCILDAQGERQEEGQLATKEAAFRGRFGTCGKMRIALEAGTHSAWVSQLLGLLGHEVLVANPRKLRAIYENDSKNDKADAEYLARVARMDPKLLSPLTHRGEETRRDLAMLRSRDALVCVRTQLINHVRGSVKPFAARVPNCSSQSFHKQAIEGIPAALKKVLSGVMDTIETLNAQIKVYDKQLEVIAQERYPQTTLLKQVPGVGPLTSLGYVLVLEDPKRFKSSRSVGSYLGLRPRQGDSGGIRPQLRITKAGDVLLRRLLVTSSHYILGPFGPDTDLRRWGLALAQRGGKNAKKRAVVAVARKLAVLLHRLWITGEVYESLRKASKPVPQKLSA